MSFRILDQSPVYFLLDGVTPAVGGSLKFYAAGTTTPKDVYGDEALTVNNGPSITLGTDGRAVDDIWGDGAYRVRLYGVDGTLVWDRDNVEVPGGTGTAIPSLVAGKYLTNDGAVLQWDTILQPLDPTGQSGKVLGSDGTSLIWQTPATPSEAPTATSTKIVIGDVTIQWGSGQFPASGTSTTNQAITYGKPFSGLPYHVEVCGTESSGVTAEGSLLVTSAINRSATGFTAWGDANTGKMITAAANFTWLAIGPT